MQPKWNSINWIGFTFLMENSQRAAIGMRRHIYENDGFKIFHHCQSLDKIFGIWQEWKMKTRRFQPRYGSNTPFLVQSAFEMTIGDGLWEPKIFRRSSSVSILQDALAPIYISRCVLDFDRTYVFCILQLSLSIPCYRTVVCMSVWVCVLRSSGVFRMLFRFPRRLWLSYAIT